MNDNTIVISGSTGLIGSALARALTSASYRVLRLVRFSNAPNDTDIPWNPSVGDLDPSRLEAVDALIHLSGENIATGRWTPAKKAAILSSRVDSTKQLANALATLKSPPKVWLCASAVGYYGNRGDELLTEDSPPGSGFLADVCKQWEAATEPAKRAGVRVVNLRFGPALSTEGGAFAQMLGPFKVGLGGVLGDGRQYVSWITLNDAVAAIVHILNNEGMSGPVNVVTPNPVTNRTFTKTLGAILGRPTVMTVPAFAARMALGPIADGALLASARVIPQRLTQSGFTFIHPDLEGALRGLLEC